MTHPSSFSLGTQARLIGLCLTKPRGDILWDGLVRGTGAVALLAIVVTALLPKLTPLIGFLVVTVWVNSPIGMVLPAMYEPVLILFGRVYHPLLIGLLGTVGTVYVEYFNYHVHGRVLAMKRLQGLRQKKLVRRVQGWFERAPFATILLCSASPLPYWLVRILSPMAGYPVTRHLLATFIGRLPRLTFFAAIGAYFRVDMRLLFTLSGVAVLVAVTMVFGFKKFRRLADHESGQSSYTVEPVSDMAL